MTGQDVGVDDGSWYNGEENQDISRVWVLLSSPKRRELNDTQEDEERIYHDTVTAEKWQVLPQIPEKAVSELKKEEEEVKRYQRGLWCAEIAETGALGWECFWMLGDKWIGCLERI